MRRTGIGIGAMPRLGKLADTWNSFTSLSPPEGVIARGAPSGEKAVRCSSFAPGAPGIAATRSIEARAV